MRLLGLDFETNAEDPETCDITEAAWVLYDTDFGTMPIVSRTFLNQDVRIMSEDAEKLTGISLKRCHEYGIPRDDIKKNLASDIVHLNPDYLVAHNAHLFDKIIYDRLLQGNTSEWIDTLWDLPEDFYDIHRTRSLELLCARHFCFTNPFPHSALPDVYTMMRILMDMWASYEAEIIKRSKEPLVVVSAGVSFENKDQAKTRGYSWEQFYGKGKRYTKKWIKRMKKDLLEKEQQEAPFKVAIID